MTYTTDKVASAYKMAMEKAAIIPLGQVVGTVTRTPGIGKGLTMAEKMLKRSKSPIAQAAQNIPSYLQGVTR